jgi:hypothetical protein
MTDAERDAVLLATADIAEEGERLKALNAELVEALKQAANTLDHLGFNGATAQKARAVLAKVKSHG